VIGAVSVGGGRIVHRDAEAQPGTATPVRAVAPADSFWLPGLGGVTRFAPPDDRQPVPPPVVRRRDRRRAGGDAHGAEGPSGNARLFQAGARCRIR
jgi:hypothetical protein